jgi:hypothetical protein
MILYEFRDPLHRSGAAAPVVVKGSRSAIEQFIPLHEFDDLFGGYVLWRTPAKPTDSMPGHGLGVWGRRTTARFRRILRERGATIERVFGRGPEQQLLIVSQHFGRN